MSELLNKLGIDYKLLIAQIINFLVLLFVLWKFAYGPILAILEKRQKKIEKGLADAEAAEKRLEESEKKQKEVLRKARTEAKEIVEMFFEEIRTALESGNQVKLSGFRNFDLRDKNQRPGRNPKTGEEIPITARRVVTFRPGQKLKARVEAYAGSIE